MLIGIMHMVQKFVPSLVMIGLIEICVTNVRSSSAHPISSTDPKSISYETCIGRAKGIDGAVQQCADLDVSKIRDAYDQYRRRKSGSSLGISEPSPFDDRHWNEAVIAHCQSQVRADTGVSLYQEYGTLERMLYRMCVRDQTIIRFESLTGPLAEESAKSQH